MSNKPTFHVAIKANICPDRTIHKVFPYAMGLSDGVGNKIATSSSR